MRLLLAVLPIMLLTGCGIVKQYTERAYTEPWCYPRIKADREKRKVEVGVGCRF